MTNRDEELFQSLARGRQLRSQAFREVFGGAFNWIVRGVTGLVARARSEARPAKQGAAC